MVEERTALHVDPPWGNPRFFSEEGLRDAQEYYFQTHAAQSRMIAEGRSAQGMSKSFLRRKLTREMGEDFKMYTGTTIGEDAAGKIESAGIRGEINNILLHIYKGIAPNQPVTSPAQEDLTILQHPHGGLEVCYAMVFFYASLLKKYASFAANKRQVLKSLMDEELFKWIWRMVIAYMMAPAEAKTNIENSTFSAGLNLIPQEQQRVPMGRKIHEIGMFLLSKALADSQLRFHLIHYFVTYLRQLQTTLLLSGDRRLAEAAYAGIAQHTPDRPVDDVLVAADLLMNSKGNSMQSFDDVLLAGPAQGASIPPQEMEFINQFEDFGNTQRLAETLRKLVPDSRREDPDGGDAGKSLMPLLLVLRTMPAEIRDAVVLRMPGPMMVMLISRIRNSPMDDVAKELDDRLKQAIDVRKRSGEKYTIHSRTMGTHSYTDSGKGSRPASTEPMLSDRGASTSAAAGSPAARSPAAGSPAAKPPAARSGAAQSSAMAATEALLTATPGAAAAGGAAAGEAQESADLPPGRLVLAWMPHAEGLAMISISAWELLTLAGADPRFLVPWVVLALKTGQIYKVSPDQVNRQKVEELVRALRRSGADGDKPLLDTDTRTIVLEDAQGGSQAKLLMNLVNTVGPKNYALTPEPLRLPLQRMIDKLGGVERLVACIKQPDAAAFAEARASLADPERGVFTLLQRIARAQ